MHTNADKITESIESLAGALIETHCSHCVYDGNMKQCEENDCIDGIAEWLNQPAVCEKAEPEKIDLSQDYIKKAGKAYLERRGCHIVAECWGEYKTIDLVFFDAEEKSKCLVLMSVSQTESGMDEQVFSCEERERDMVAFMADHCEQFPEDMQIRFDTLTIVKAGESKALIKHHINASNRD